MKKCQWLVVLLLMVLVSCVTINIYFPAAAVQKAAEQIVDEIRSGNEKQPVQPTPGEASAEIKSEQQGFRVDFIRPAEAAERLDINVSTSTIRGLKQSMKKRYPRLKDAYQQGFFGEGADGLLHLRQKNQLPLKKRAWLSNLVKAENSDRQALYEEIVRANRLGADATPKVTAIFARTFRAKAQNGWWIQDDKGSWLQK